LRRAHAGSALTGAASDVQGIVTNVEIPRGSINGFELARRVLENRQDISVLIASGRVALKARDLP